MRKRPSIWFTLFMLLCLCLPLALAACGEASPTASNSTSTPTNNSTTTTGAASTTAAATSGSSTTRAASTTAAATSAAATTAAATVAAATTAAAAATTAAASEPGSETSKGGSTAAAATTAAATTAAAAAGSGASSGAPSSDSSAVYPAPTGGTGSKPAPNPNQPVYNQQPLKAGAVDDNAKFGDYLQYLQSYRDQPVLPFDVSERYIISVVDANSRTVSNATVKITANQTLIFQGKTYSNGQVLFFPKALPSAAQVTQFEVAVEKGGQTLNKSFKRIEQGQNQGQSFGATWTLELTGYSRSQQQQGPTTLDLLFLLDSTGSMGGEIRRIQQTISDIAYQITTLPGQPRLRFGLVTYRDRGDSYVTRKYGFTENVGEFSTFLNSISAGGGGDYPESLNEGLHVAVNEMNWTTDDALRLTFLVADAPPHLDYANDYKYTNELVDAVRQGIKVYSIGASGLTRPGEYVFRQLSQITLAQYLFITRGGDERNPGSGGPASNTGISSPEKTLDQLVVDIVRQEMNNLSQ